MRPGPICSLLVVGLLGCAGPAGDLDAGDDDSQLDDDDSQLDDDDSGLPDDDDSGLPDDDDSAPANLLPSLEFYALSPGMLSTGVWQLNTQTGEVTALGTISGVQPHWAGVNSLDAGTGTLYMSGWTGGPPSVIATIDLPGASLLGTAPAERDLWGLYPRSDGALLTMSPDLDTWEIELMTVDPVTGELDVLGTVPELDGLGTGAFDVDPAADVIYTRGQTTSGMEAIFAIDLFDPAATTWTIFPELYFLLYVTSGGELLGVLGTADGIELHVLDMATGGSTVRGTIPPLGLLGLQCCFAREAGVLFLFGIEELGEPMQILVVDAETGTVLGALPYQGEWTFTGVLDDQQR